MSVAVSSIGASPVRSTAVTAVACLVLVSVGVLLGALALVFRFSPRRRQPAPSWLAVGSGVSLVGILLVTAALHWYLNASQSLGDTYGPLAGFIGLMLWALLSSIALLYGLSFAAQLEATGWAERLYPDRKWEL